MLESVVTDSFDEATVFRNVAPTVAIAKFIIWPEGENQRN